MAHQTFYRKYRSQTFKEVVGQEHIIQTLTNAMTFDRLSHAYIFSGPRGTGKTSTARILAKIINCPEKKDGDPCLSCSICTGIAKGVAVDVMEIDAASNTGVDHIRELNDKVRFMPVECDTKLYIIDEAHMLSTGAFNALLKTIEEPPPKTIFILATTEPHKIPVTIHSRCQHLNFRKLKTSELVSHLRKISTEENIDISDKSLGTLARNASGCMRDAVSLLDQIYSFKGNKVEYEDVLLILGATNITQLYALLDAFFGNDVKTTMQMVSAICEEGGSVVQLIQDLTVLLKQVLYLKMSLTEYIELDDAGIEKLKVLADKVSMDRLKVVIESFAKVEMELRWFSNPELLLQSRFLLLLADNAEKRAAQSKGVAPVANRSPARVSAPAPVSRTPVAPPAAQAPRQSPAPAAPRPVAPVTPPKEDVMPVITGPITLDVLKANWSKFLAMVKKNRHAIFALLKDSTPQGLNEDIVTIRLAQNLKFFREKLGEDEQLLFLNETLSGVFGKSLTYTLGEETQAVAVPASKERPAEAMGAPVTEASSSSSRRVNDIVTMFEGSIV